MAKKGRKPIASIAVALIRSANDVVGLDIHSVNAASAVHSGRTINVKKTAR